VAFRIARPVFTLAVRLIDRLAVDAGTGGARVLVVRVDVIDLDDQAGIRHVDAARRVEMVLGGDAMQPDGDISRKHLTMNRLPVGCSMHTSRREPKCANQEVVCGGDVLIGEQRNDSFESCHELLRLRQLQPIIGGPGYLWDV
jgi:hypothetical protein